MDLIFNFFLLLLFEEKPTPPMLHQRLPLPQSLPPPVIQTHLFPGMQVVWMPLPMMSHPIKPTQTSIISSGSDAETSIGGNIHCKQFNSLTPCLSHGLGSVDTPDLAVVAYLLTEHKGLHWDQHQRSMPPAKE